MNSTIWEEIFSTIPCSPRKVLKIWLLRGNLVHLSFCAQRQSTYISSFCGAFFVRHNKKKSFFERAEKRLLNAIFWEPAAPSLQFHFVDFKNTKMAVILSK